MKRLTGGVVAVALLLAGCGSAETPVAETVTQTMATTATAVTTKLTTKTVTTTSVKTTKLSTTVIAKPDPKTGSACAAVGAELSSNDILEPMQKWSGGATITVGDISGGIATFTEIPTEGAPTFLAVLINDLNDAAVTMRDGEPADWSETSDDVLSTWDLVANECTTSGTPIPAVKIQVKTETVTSEVAVGGDGQAVDSVSNGDYLVPGDLTPGVYRCSAPTDGVYWKTTTADGQIVDNGLDSLARITDEAYAITLKRCDGDWQKVS